MHNFDVLVNRYLNEDKEWGDVAWGDLRNDDVEREPSTDDELSALDDLEKHFDDLQKLPASRGHEIEKLSNEKEYAEILKFPEDQYPIVYRGMGVKVDYLSKILKITPDNFKIGEVYDVDFIAKPRHQSSSWSIDKRKSAFFAKTFASEGAGIILYANTSENRGSFILNPQKIYAVTRLRDYKGEKETIGVGSIKVSKVEIVDLNKSARLDADW